MPNTDDGEGQWRLLGTLTDEELIRYGEIVGQQVALEWQYAWLQVLGWGAAFVALGVGIVLIAAGGLAIEGLAMVGLAVTLGYWPYQRARMRRFWHSHKLAVEAELDGRQVEPKGTHN